jgi:catechol 2,3-dioxygenase-like lactoylglutathione lyase family enzyme
MSTAEVTPSAPVSVVVIGVEDFNASMHFFRDTLGLQVADERTWKGPDFERYWNLPAGSAARCAFLGHGADPVGRIQLMEFDAVNRKRVRSPEQQRATGLININVYTRDIEADYKALEAQGFRFWSKPVNNDFGPAVGATREVLFDAPDGLVVNLIQLVTEDPDSLCGKILRFISQYGRTETGFTSVVTTAAGVFDMEKALEFYYGPLQMTLFMDSTLAGAETNRGIGLPDDAETRIVIVQGDHEYGKIALSCPVNYEIDNLVPDAVPPNIGYLAQSFQVSDLEQCADACNELGTEYFSGPTELDLPGRGFCRAMIVRNPGSGALQEIFEVA